MTEAEFIKKKRQAVGLTQQKAADLLRISLKQYQRLEYGGRSVLKTNLQLAMSVAILLRFDPGEFVRAYEDGLGDVWLIPLSQLPNQPDVKSAQTTHTTKSSLYENGKV